MAIELVPDLALGYNNRGFAYYALGEYEQAIQNYDKAIELIPDFALAYYNRSLGLRRLKQQESADRDLVKACDLDSNLC